MITVDTFPSYKFTSAAFPAISYYVITSQFKFKMSEVATKIVQCMKCSMCQNYLSSPPITSNKRGQNMCAKCSVHKSSSRNIVLEEVAKLIPFPCQYQRHGCKIILPYKSRGEHEVDCSFRKYECIVGDCSWIGNYDQIYDHCLEDHFDSVAKHPFTADLDVGRKKDEIFMMTFKNFIFVLNVKHDIVLDEFSQSMFLLGNEKIPNLFSYRCSLKGPDGRIQKSFSVKSYPNENNDKMKISCMIPILGHISDVKLTFTIQMKQNQCDLCNSTILYYPVFEDNGKYCCRDCKQKENPEINSLFCSNRDEGCTYECSKKMDLNKHEKWFCEKGVLKCIWGCGKIMKDINRFDHYMTNYAKFRYSADFENQEVGKEYINCIYVRDVKFLCKWFASMNGTFYIFMVSEKSSSPHIRMTINFTNVDTNQYVSRMMRKPSWEGQSDNYDYTITINDFQGSGIKIYNLKLTLRHLPLTYLK